MPKLSDVDVAQGAITAIIMGKPGTGKTTLVSSFPRVRLMDFDKKVKAALNPEWIKKLGRVPDLEFKEFVENSLVKGYALKHNAFDDACRWFDELMGPALRNTFDYFAVDSITALTETAQNKALIVLGGAKRSSTHDSASTTGLAMLQKQDFGGINSLIKQFLRMLIDSGKGVLAIVHEKETTNDAGLLVSIDPMLIGQNVQQVPSMFQNVWHLRIEGVPPNHKRKLYCDFDGIRMARSELGLGVIEEPTYDKIIARIRERQTAANAAKQNPTGTPPAGGPPAPLTLAK